LSVILPGIMGLRHSGPWGGGRWMIRAQGLIQGTRDAGCAGIVLAPLDPFGTQRPFRAQATLAERAPQRLLAPLDPFGTQRPFRAQATLAERAPQGC
jgi:hypothetical protein